MTAVTFERLLQHLTAAAIHACAAHEAIRRGSYALGAMHASSARIACSAALDEIAVCQDVADPWVFLSALQRQMDERSEPSG